MSRTASGTSIALKLGASLFIATCLVSMGVATVCSKNTNEICESFNALAMLVKFVPLLVTRFVVLMMKLSLTLLVCLFTGNPLDSASKFTIGVLTDVSGGLGVAIMNFLCQAGVAIMG
jgi:hypothetical protein